MTPELWQRLKPLFNAALRVGPEDRAAFIKAACGDDAELKAHLEGLVKAEQEDTGSLDTPLANLNGLFNAKGTRFQAGEVVLGRFRIIRPIGKGGMGEVYEAEDLQLGIVALKTIRNGVATSLDAFERFRQEVQLARRVSGSQVCRIHELYLLPASGEYPATAFLTMEYLDGVTLFEKIRAEGPIPWKQAISVSLQICEGLRLIHEKGIIHRDLKTGNIMSCKQGEDSRIVLMDFGLARDFQLKETERETSETLATPGTVMPQMIVGTPEYMAPEQFEGKPVSPATDIYALGIILYELVTGIHPYAADTPVAAAIRRARRPMPPSSLRSRIPRQCDRFIERCLEYDPSKRFQTAEAAAKALKAGPANFENLRMDRPWVLWFASAMFLGLVAGSTFFFWQSRQYYRPNAEALRWYNSGVTALREGNNVKATRSLQEAVSHDNHFAMAHARLAQAWANLDFDGNAQRELLIAAPAGRHLQPLDRMYLDAIHATVTKDTVTEIAAYQQILSRLPPDQKSSGYVDLGMAYERGGDLNHALDSYSRAESLDDRNPAPIMHSAVLQSRQHHVPEADTTFRHAQDLLTAEMNQEGLAELDYARGLAANDNGDAAEAKQFLDRSLDEAIKIPSVQLQIRDLDQLSGSADRSDPARAAEYAKLAVRLARENQLNAWAADGLVRLAGAEINLGNFQDADDSVQEALQLARQTQQPRVEAMANLTLASLMNQRDLPDQVIGPAQSAFDFYRRNSYFRSAASASVLLIRAKRDKGQYKEALESADAFLVLANKSGIHLLMMQAEEAIGRILLQKEQYPDALIHFLNAKALADNANSRAYQAIDVADTLWRLGRYGESDTMLQFEPVGEILSITVAETRADSFLSRGEYGKALSLIRQTTKQYSKKMQSSDQQQLQIARAVAEAHLGMKKEALSDLKEMEKQVPSDRPNSAEDPATVLRIAEVNLYAGSVAQAHVYSVREATHFAATAQLDSELCSVGVALVSAKKLNNIPEGKKYSMKAVDIVSQIQHTWSPQDSQTYLARPDLHFFLREVPEAAHQDRRQP